MVEIKTVPAAPDYEVRQFLRIVVRRYPELPDESGMISPYASQWQFRMDMMIGGVQHNFEWLQPSQDTEPAPYPWMIRSGLRHMASKIAN
jgi:hypothetical protein